MKAISRGRLVALGIVVAACHGNPETKSNKVDPSTTMAGAPNDDSPTRPLDQDPDESPERDPNAGGASSTSPDPDEPPSSAAGAGSPDAPDQPDLPAEPDPAAGCTSGKLRNANESEGPEMMPGFACLACHAAFAASDQEDPPNLAFGGTLYPTADEPSGCIGSAALGAEVVVRDSAGLELHAIANQSGNFLVKDMVLTPPFDAVVLFGGRERKTTTPHTSGDCNACHTEAEGDPAPGRVLLP